MAFWSARNSTLFARDGGKRGGGGWRTKGGLAGSSLAAEADVCAESCESARYIWLAGSSVMSRELFGAISVDSAGSMGSHRLMSARHVQ